MRKVDCLSLIFIDFYVPALTPRLNSTEPSLQLSENITLFVTDQPLTLPLLITSRHGPRRKHRSSFACVSVAARTFLWSRSLAAASIVIKIYCLAANVISLFVSAFAAWKRVYKPQYCIQGAFVLNTIRQIGIFSRFSEMTHTNGVSDSHGLLITRHFYGLRKN
jgi:hypothetical protein